MVEGVSKKLYGKRVYRLGDKIGDGAQGEIYKAKSKENEVSSYWAIKQFDKKVMQLNLKRLQNMMKEIECLSQVKQSTQLVGIQNIVHLEECIMTSTNYYLVFEFCNGGDLRDMMSHHSNEI